MYHIKILLIIRASGFDPVCSTAFRDINTNAHAPSAFLLEFATVTIPEKRSLMGDFINFKMLNFYIWKNTKIKNL